MSRAKPRFKRINTPLPALSSNLFQAQVIGSIESQTTVNTFLFLDNKPLGSPTSAAEAELVTGMGGPLMTKYCSSISLDWTMTTIKVQVLNMPARAPYSKLPAGNVVGLRTTGHEPTEIAQIVLRGTAYKGQSGRGRLSLPGVAVADVTNSRLTAAALTVLGQFATELLNTITTANNVFTPALASRRGPTNNPTYGAAALTSSLATSLLGTIRRRKIGRGR